MYRSAVRGGLASKHLILAEKQKTGLSSAVASTDTLTVKYLSAVFKSSPFCYK